MRKQALALLIVAALTLRPSTARADSLGDALFKAVVVILVVTAATAATVETLTGVATYKNYRASSRNQEPSAGWVGVGAVGGLLNLGVGFYGISRGLPSTVDGMCDDPSQSTTRAAGTWEPPPQRPCKHHVPANSASLIAGVLLTGFGGFALGSAIMAARSGPDAPAAQAGPAPTTMSYGLVLPPFRF